MLLNRALYLCHGKNLVHLRQNDWCNVRHLYICHLSGKFYGIHHHISHNNTIMFQHNSSPVPRDNTCEDPHGTMYSINIPTGQHVHEELKKSRPSFRPVPVCYCRKCIGYTGAHLADGLSQSAWQQVTYSCFSLRRKDKNVNSFYSSMQIGLRLSKELCRCK